MISPCYYDCHIGCCISCSCSCSQRFSSFISLATLNLNDQWTETRDRACWAESECEHLAPRARGKWVVSSVSVRVQSKEQHMRELLYPIIATFYYAKRILHVVCAVMVVGSEISWRDARDSWIPDIRVRWFGFGFFPQLFELWKSILEVGIGLQIMNRSPNNKFTPCWRMCAVLHT